MFETLVCFSPFALIDVSMKLIRSREFVDPTLTRTDHYVNELLNSYILVPLSKKIPGPPSFQGGWGGGGYSITKSSAHAYGHV